MIAIIVRSQAEDKGRRTGASVRCSKREGEPANGGDAPHEDQDRKIGDDEDVLGPGAEDQVEEDVQQDEDEVEQDRLWAVMRVNTRAMERAIKRRATRTWYAWKRT